MRALVVYESMFGNTQTVAEAIAEGLATAAEVEIHEVSDAPPPGPGVDLVVVGGPTHAFSMSRASTRADAVKQGATHGDVQTGLREWLGQLTDGPHAEKVAAFDTRVDKVRRLPGSAAKKAVKVVHELGYATAGRESFYVGDVAGPLLPGEVERAKTWGARLASELAPASGR